MHFFEYLYYFKNILFYKYLTFYFLVEQFLLESLQSKLSNSSVKEQKRRLKNPVAEMELVRWTLFCPRLPGPASPSTFGAAAPAWSHALRGSGEAPPSPLPQHPSIQGPQVLFKLLTRAGTWSKPCSAKPRLYKETADWEGQPVCSQRGILGIHLQQLSLVQCLTRSCCPSASKRHSTP